MPKARTAKDDDTLELDFGKSGEREFSGSDANPVDASTGETLFDDLSPRFVRQIEEAAAREGTKVKPRGKATEDDDLDPSDEDFEDPTDEDEDEVDPVDADEDEDETDEYSDPNDKDEDEGEEDEVDEDADEPRRGTKFEKRIARSERIIDEVRAENSELRARLDATEASTRLAASTTEYEATKAQIEQKLKKLRADKVTAVENGETAAQVDIDDQMVELRAELRAKTDAYNAAKKQIEEAGKRRQASPITLIKVAQWKRKNPRYDTDPVFAAAVNAIDNRLAAGGSNPESDAHYRAIDAELKKQGLIKIRAKTPARRHPSSQVSRESAPMQRRRGGEQKAVIKDGKLRVSKSRLERAKQTMAKFGMDPSNKNDIRDFFLNNPDA